MAAHSSPSPGGESLFSLAQIVNLKYRRLSIGSALMEVRRSGQRAVLQDGILRYSSARQSRNQRSAAVSAGPAAAGGNGTKGRSETGTSGGSDALRLVLRTQPRSVESSRLATISTDTGRVEVLEVCATGGASTLTLSLYKGTRLYK